MKPLYVKKNGVVYKISGNGMPALYPAENVEYDNTVTSELQATDVQGAIDELSTRQDIKNTAYGTCDTAGDVKDKVATLVNATNWSLEVGTIVGVRFTYTNTYTPSSGNNVTLNVNNTGAKNIRYSDGIGTGTSDAKCPIAYGEAGQTIYYMYDGTYWVWVSHSKDNDTLYNFKGNEFRSADGNNYGQETGYGGNANYMVVNGHYYYNSNGPSTDIGASANDGAIYVQALDEDNVTQIAQNYETGNLFVRSKVNGSWTEWKKTVANITANNTVLSTDKTPFLTRQTLNPTGFSGYVREKLIGASYAWNQLLNESEFTDQTSGLTVTLSNHKLSINGTTTAGSNYRFASGKTLYAGHKYALFGITKFTSSSSALGRVYVYNSSTSTICVLGPNLTSAIFSVTTTANYNIYYNIGDANITVSFEAYMQLVDLTLAFGSTIADYLYNLTNNGGITKLRDMGCPIDKYTPYGNYLISSKTSEKLIRGFNLWDEEWEQGDYNNAGQKVTGDGIRSVNKIPILPDTLYYWRPNYTGQTYYWVCEFDANQTIIQRIAVMPRVYTPSVNTRYIAFNTASAYGGTYKNDICFNINTPTGSPKNGDYVPYSCITYSLGNDELRGKFDLVNGEIVASGDVKESNGEITRNYGIADLGSFVWAYNATRERFNSATKLPNNNTTRTELNWICEKYTTSINAYSDADRTYGVITIEGGWMYVRDNNYTDANTFKTAMNGVYLIYELETPTTEQSTPFADPMSMVSATTEEYIDTRDIPCPVGAERQYMGQSDDVVEIPSRPQSDGKRVLISEVSGDKERVYWDIPKLYYKEYTVQGDGTKTYGDLLAELKPYYLTLSEDEKTYSKVMMRATSSGNECLTFVGNYWYSRMGVNASGLWLDQVDFEYNRYFKQASGGSITEETNINAAYNVIALRVLTYTRAES